MVCKIISSISWLRCVYNAPKRKKKKFKKKSHKPCETADAVSKHLFVRPIAVMLDRIPNVSSS